MPIYAYVCKDCGNTFERIAPMKDRDNPWPCAKCQGTNLHRCVGSFAVKFTGEGWATPIKQRQLSTERMDL